MTRSRRAHLCSVIAFLVLFISSTLAQRPSSASVCDYYAQNLYGANSSDTQHKLVQHIVALAFEGGTQLKNVSSEITGILRPGKFGGVDINLLQFFNGSKASTNVNNAAIGINWLDQGGTTPLSAFLTGETESLVLANSSNQYHLFGNFFVAFSRAFGCTLPFPPLPNSSGPISLAYAHKFMGLNFNQLGYFIHQLTQATIYYGFSTQDAETLRTRLNSLYNVRCAPGVTFNPAAGPQLLSLCQDPTCPLAAPVSDCAAYENLTANAIPSSNPTTISATATVTGASSTSSATGGSEAAPATSDKLSTGGIAGVAIGGAAVLLLAVVAVVLLMRKRRREPLPTSEAPAPSWDPSRFSSPGLDPTSPYTAKNSHMSYYSTGQPPSEMDTSRYQNPGDMSIRVASPEMGAYPSYNPQSAHPAEMGVAPVEMDTAPAGAHQWQQGYGGQEGSGHGQGVGGEDTIQYHGSGARQQPGL